MKNILSIIGLILLFAAWILPFLVDKPLTVILLLWIYVIIRKIQEWFE